MKIAIAIVSALFLFSACKSLKEQEKCLHSYINEVSEEPEYNIIRSAAKDTVAKWATMNIRTFYGINNFIWKIDSAVFYNEYKSKAILLILESNPKYTATYDDVKMLAAEKKEGIWYFYAATMPSIGFFRNLNPREYNSPFTYQELSDISRRNLIHGGYYKKGSCKVNYKWVNGWFENPLAKYHQEWLKNRIKQAEINKILERIKLHNNE